MKISGHEEQLLLYIKNEAIYHSHFTSGQRLR